MLDRKFVVENLAIVRANCAQRGIEVDLEGLAELDHQCRDQLNRVQELNRQANEVSKSIGQAKDADQREARKEEGRRLRDQKDQAQREYDRMEIELLGLLRQVPNMAHPDSPRGAGDAAAREFKRGKMPIPGFDFEPLDHVALGEKLDLFDFDAAARVSGHGFYYLKNDAVRLDLALQLFVLDVLQRHGFTPMTTPDLARREILEGIGFNPRGRETQIYQIDDSDLCLVATAEITLGGLLAEQTIDESQLPVKLCGISHCFRTEAGAHGRDTRGLYRVHQFTKVEMFAFTTPGASDAMLELFCEIECEIFDALEIPYRVIDTPIGDLGAPAYRKYDLEAWMPGRGGFGEVTSTSNCTDYQARRLNIRFKRKGEKGTHLVHTLNGTAVATGRALIAVLENHQRADGSVAVPAVLRPWVGKATVEVRGWNPAS
jgi:seryl-tRNA synthetase